jgi:hypothetical protein
MSGAMPPLPQYTSMGWCLVKSTEITLPYYAVITKLHDLVLTKHVLQRIIQNPPNTNLVAQRWATGWMIGGVGIFLFTTASRLALRPIQPLIQWVPGALSLRVKRPGREADHSPPSRAKVKECVELYLHSRIRLHCVVLSYKKAQGQPYFTLLLSSSSSSSSLFPVTENI